MHGSCNFTNKTKFRALASKMTFLEMLKIPGMDGSERLREMQEKSRIEHERRIYAQILAMQELKRRMEEKQTNK